jgi:catechol 2,3-dioxygenase-like lactoylglutathione lyase family enzyme
MSTEATMTTLSSAMLGASIAVSDMARARPVYEDQLGLSVAEDRPDGSRIYASGGGAWLHVDPFPDNAGKATATLGTWYVAELEQLVDRLSANGVRLERYDDPALQTDGRGIAETEGGGTVAWFTDPDGNTFAIEQKTASPRTAAAHDPSAAV